MTAGLAAVVRRPEQVPGQEVAAGVTVAEMLDDRHGCRGLHQRRVRLDGGAVLAGTAEGQGEAWFVISGSGTLEAGTPGTPGTVETGAPGAVEAGGPGAVEAGGPGAVEAGGPGTAALQPGTAVWLGSARAYRVRAGSDLEVVACTLRAGTPAEGPELIVTTLDECLPEHTGDREFRVLLSEGLTFTQFAGLIPPGRAPQHQHTYDEVVHVLAGHGVAHLPGGATEIGPGTSVYLPPHTPHCLENRGPDVLRVLGVFHPAGSPAAKREG